MKRPILLAALALAACVQGGPPRQGGPRLKPSADPSAVIAAELAFNTLAQSKGQWTAFRETAAPGAEMFVPERVLAADWLKNRADPPVSVKWQPTAMWSSCDGSFAVTRGDWQRPGSTGEFATVWQRQGDGKYRWVLDMSLGSERPVGAPEMISATVADCSAVPAMTAAAPPSGSDSKDGGSRDRTLTWRSTVQGDGGRSIAVHLWKGGQMRQVLAEQVPAALAR